MWCSAASLQALSEPLPLPTDSSPLSSGGLLTLWVRSEKTLADPVMVKLVLKEKTGGKTRYQQLHYTRANQTDWSRLSAWIPAAQDGAERTLILESPDGAGILRERLRMVKAPPQKASFSPGFLRVRGADLLNEQGTFLFRGVNVTAYSDEEKESVPDVLGMVTEEDYRQIAAFGFNSVRLACWHRALAGADGIEWLRLQVSLARQYGLYLILDMHAPPSGYQSNKYRGPFWHPEKGEPFRAQLLAFWQQVAREFRDEPVIAAYDLLNEPKPKKDSQWHEYVRLLIRAIRDEGDAHAIVVETSMLDEAQWVKFEDDSIIYDTHWYEPWSFVAQSEKKPWGDYGKHHRLWGEEVILNRDYLAKRLALYQKWCAEHRVPMQVGEYGVNHYTQSESIGGLHWLSDMVSLFEEFRISRFYWSWFPFDMGICEGWWRRDPGVVHSEVAAIAARPLPDSPKKTNAKRDEIE